uniref:Uncharacterized protein n=1 Tax=Lepeophtheirus salmonis TaxID=72036 RepID=A0A0K2UZG6_LEPSM
MTTSIMVLAGCFDPLVNFTLGKVSLGFLAMYQRPQELLTGSTMKFFSSEKMKTFLWGFYNLLRRIFDRSSLFCLCKTVRSLTFVTLLDLRAKSSLKTQRTAAL